jgi:heme exporter protein D
MEWSSLSDFWKACLQFFWMGGYGLYVWGSYGVTFLLLGGEVLILLKRKRDLAHRESPREFGERRSQLDSSFQETQ